jgi:hypothetical protein
MAGRTATPQGRKLDNINNMPNRRYLPSVNFSVPFAMSLLTGLLRQQAGTIPTRLQFHGRLLSSLSY